MLSTIEKSIENKRFPHSCLFYGQKFSLRFTNALQCAENLLSTTNLYQNTSNIYVVLNRPLTDEMMFFIDNLSSNINKNTLDLLHSAFTNFILRLSYIILKESKENKIGLSSDDIAVLYKIYDDFSNYKITSNFSVDEVTEKLSQVTKLISKIKYKSTFNINDVRLFKELAGVSSINGKPKIFIIEGLEEASIGARNAFLKLLEEPPENTYFIIITSDKQRLEATILSRLSLFEFPSVDDLKKKEIISSFNKDPDNYKTLEEFFLSTSSKEEIIKFAIKFKNSILEKDKRGVLSLLSIDLKSITQKSDDRTSKNIILSITEAFYNDFINGVYNFSYYQKVLASINKTSVMVEVYNESLSNALLGLYYDILKFNEYFYNL